MILYAIDYQGDVILEEIYFSVGGGFIIKKSEFSKQSQNEKKTEIPYPFKTAAEMLQMARSSGKSIAKMKRDTEKAFRSDAEIKDGLLEFGRLWMCASSEALKMMGISQEG